MADEQGMLEQFYQPAAIAERRISEERLDAALRNGIVRGTQAKSRQRIRRITVSCAAAVLLMIGSTFAMNGLNIGNRTESAVVHTAANNQIPPYVNYSAGDKGMLREALDQGKYQAVQKTVANEGYQVTVDGIVTDGKHLALFYTSKSDNGDRITPQAPGLFTSAHDKLKYKQFVFDTNQLTGYYDLGSYHDMLVFDLTGNESLPEEFYFASKWGNSDPGSAQKFLEIKIPVDTSKLAELERTMEVNKTLDFEGQKVKIKNIVQIPLRLNVNLDMDAANSKKIVTLPNWELYTKNTRGNVLPKTMVMSDSERILGFYAPDYVQGELLGLRGSWIETEFKGGRKLILNTKEQKIISAPDERVKLQGIEKKDGYLRITTTLPSLEPDVGQYTKVNFTYTDGEGITHRLSSTSNKETVHEGWRHDRNANLTLYYFDIENKSYPQPLTFKLDMYPGDFIRHPFDLIIQK
ncbi:DUF4179 domain-containing protein [Paenibacillus sp.]|jgi:hypothetical protein|uniref:DUF4179 domain-containing protein n=1 Tax=Paenibacillus sp. TaxID=58172 RepID=UPI00282F6659|nr:DUF4179 domain-containing protein [Paenibacillus sp.]MDR0270738.1 DUF4179 domain-containing protein [Paenibacillus sp.]